jgi:hypothetical protein
MEHVWSFPELIETAVLAASSPTSVIVSLSVDVPSPNCPNELLPQHWSDESSRIAQRWSPPLDIVVSVNIDPDWKPGSFNPSDTGCLMSSMTPTLEDR